MGLFHSIVATLICLLSIAVARAQDRAAAIPSSKDQSAATVSQAQTAIDRAAAANKYVFLFFWKDDSSEASKVLGMLKPAVAKMAEKAVFVSIRITNPAEKKIVDKYGVSRAPMPMVLAIAPSGAVTRAFTKTFDEKELRTAFVSPCKERCLTALQSRKLVLVCVMDQANPQGPPIVFKGVDDFKADKKYGAAAEVVRVNVRDAAEATFLKELDIAPDNAPITVFLGPPGAIIGTFSRSAAKNEFVTVLTRAQSGGCSGRSCGPGGCGAKK